MSYDPSSRLFSVYSEDLTLVGLRTITVEGYYVLHQANSFTVTFQIEMVSPCKEPSVLALISPDDIPVTVQYYLSESDQYQVPEFLINYDFCQLEYAFEI